MQHEALEEEQIHKMLGSFHQAAFICYNRQLWMNQALALQLDGETHLPLMATVPRNMHHVLSQNTSQMFRLELQNEEKRVCSTALITQLELGTYYVTLGLLLDDNQQANSQQTNELPVIAIHTFESSALDEQRASLTLQAINDAIISIDSNGYIDFINTSAELMLGLEAKNAIDRKLDEVLILSNGQNGESISPLHYSFSTPETKKENEQLLIQHHGTGLNSAVEIISSPMQDIKGNQFGNVLVIHDISDIQHMSAQLLYQAQHDSLTGMINRGEFERRVKTVLKEVQSNRQQHVMCYIDLDEFKVVNDTCGHLAGDELLRQISAHIKSHTKQRDIVARLGGDEFGIVLMECDIEHAKVVTERIRKSVQDHIFNWDSRTFHIGCSIGVMMIDPCTGTLDDLLTSVDNACYEAKKSGKNQVVFVNETPDIIQQRHTEADCLRHIRHALELDRFQLYTQTITTMATMDINNDHTTHQEILLRMLDDNDQIIEPSKFINTAQRYRLMPAIDRWVIRNVLARLSDSEDPLNNSDINYTAINLSSQSIADPSFAEDVSNYFMFSSVSADKICFEISESAIVSNIDQASRFMLELSSLGVHFSLDNFCNNLSSFSYIKKLPVDFLKIDGRLMQNLIDDEVDTALISAIRDITNILGIQTIAECVEDRYTYNALKTLGIDFAQGFYISEPKDLLQQYEKRLAPPLNIH